MNEGRHSQYMDKIENNIDKVKNIALLVVGDRDAQGTPGVRVEDYELASIRMDAKIAELRLATEEEMTEAQHKEHTRLASKFNDNFLNSFRNL